MRDADLEKRAIDVIRGLAMDAPHKANSGHQGTAMALAPLAHVLWTRVMRYDAADPDWPDRDRFVLSAGHASILLYSMLHLTGHGLELEDLKQFRQWGSRTPGHPEVGHTRGVEVTTGPLGQGFANAVGMAMAERWLAARFGAELFDHHTFVIAGDGDLSEGVSHEAASLAGHQGLDKLVVVYDDNHITIDGPTELALADDAALRFRGYGWNVVELGEAAEDLDALEAALLAAKEHTGSPTLLRLRSHIAHPSPTLTDSPKAHGLAFDDDTIREAKAVMGLPDEPFHVPGDVLSYYRAAGERGRSEREGWEKRLAAFGGDRAALDCCLDAEGLPGWEDALPTFTSADSLATRQASGKVLQALIDKVPGLVGGGADLTGNTGTAIADAGVMGPDDPGGRQVFFGVREHGMAAIMNGMALHGGLLPVGGTFLVFSDYARGAIRLSALSGAKVIYSFTHDSVGVGEDGPTHQPVEHVAALRAIPGLSVIRPADANETAAAWRCAIGADGPTALILSRQSLPTLEGTSTQGVLRGAYVLVDPGSAPDLVLVATGSEVHVCVEAAAELAADGTATSVVSMPSWNLFEAQDEAYRSSVLPAGVPTLAVEAGVSFGWERYADDSVSIDTFGHSAPGELVLEKLGYTAENVAARGRDLLARS
ncbi:MAG TPA: transketolase [Acidimicrobiales bacterium]|nr:transketolase [Acidimicrobiales bacterium]